MKHYTAAGGAGGFFWPTRSLCLSDEEDGWGGCFHSESDPDTFQPFLPLALKSNTCQQHSEGYGYVTTGCSCAENECNEGNITVVYGPDSIECFGHTLENERHAACKGHLCYIYKDPPGVIGAYVRGCLRIGLEIWNQSDVENMAYCTSADLPDNAIMPQACVCAEKNCNKNIEAANRSMGSGAGKIARFASEIFFGGFVLFFASD